MIDSGHTAWILISAALVMFLIPGLAFFYGGLVRSKDVLSTLTYCFMALGLVIVLWTIVGHTLAFGPDIGKVIGKGGWIGGLDFLGFKDVGDAPSPLAPGIPHTAYAIYQMMFAVITPALIAGAYAERLKFTAYLAFTSIWVLVVYAPVAHWVWGGGFLGADGLGALDFAGGTVVHQTAGMTALAVAVVLGKGHRRATEDIGQRNVQFVGAGAFILWLGWFGFNGGSAQLSSAPIAMAFSNTHIATAAAILGSIIPEWFQHRRASLVGAATGAVAGLVAVSSASGFIRPWSSLILGFVAGSVCYLAVNLVRRFNDDSITSVVGVLYVGALVGSLLTGVFARGAGLAYSGEFAQLSKQILAALVVAVWTFAVSFVLLKVIDWTVGLRQEPVKTALLGPVLTRL